MTDPRKAAAEFAYWSGRKQAEGTLAHGHYAQFYTDHFGLSPEFYRGKRILDVGCGPRGSLEWASMAAERVGLDPLVESYRALGIDAHHMSYVVAAAEAMPFADGQFDVVCSFNSLDHVDHLDRAIAEIIRVLASGGLFLLLADIHDVPTVEEPSVFSWDIVDRFVPPLERLHQHAYEKRAGGMYESILAGIPFDRLDTSQRYGVLSAQLRKP